mmetsp:Transcript_63632/g.170455  ORF Transcript_63632/g.170455 Transcript_63632/m.170455 type:complete len:736 (+) Transcript_63632:41-2248(+)
MLALHAFSEGAIPEVAAAAKKLERRGESIVVEQWLSFAEKKYQEGLAQLLATLDDGSREVEELLEEACALPGLDTPLSAVLRERFGGSPVCLEVCSKLKPHLQAWGRRQRPVPPGAPPPNALRVAHHERAAAAHRRWLEGSGGTWAAAEDFEAALQVIPRWSDLSRICLADLSLFQTHAGKVVDVEVVASSIVASSVTTLVADRQGGLVQLALYNWGGAHEAQGDGSLAVGSRLQVADPYLKVFRDGEVGIRVDRPAQVLYAGRDATAWKQVGNAFIKQGQPRSAWESYRAALSAPELDALAVLLCDRAQCLLQSQSPVDACCDAAAAVWLRPRLRRAWELYSAALRSAGLRKLVPVVTAIIEEHPLDSIPVADTEEHWIRCVSCCTNVPAASDGPATRKEARSLYSAGDFAGAAECYGRALAGSAGLTLATEVLLNMAQASLASGWYANTAGTALAALRLAGATGAAAHRDKAGYRLCVAMSYLVCPRAAETAAAAVVATSIASACRSPIDEGLAAQRFVSDGYAASDLQSPRVGARGLAATPEWSAPGLVVTKFPGRGRGLVSSEGLDAGAVVMVARAVGGGPVDGGAILGHLRADQRSSQALALLSCGEDEATSVVTISDLMSAGLPMLPALGSAPEFCPPPRFPCAAWRVPGVLRTNGFEAPGREDGAVLLYPAVSLLNHSDRPNCAMVPASRCGAAVAVVVVASVSAGEELTVCYGPSSHLQETVHGSLH